MTPYEAEQEETAIISYDELVKQNDKPQEIELLPANEVDEAVAQVDNNLEVPFVEEVTITEDVPVKEEIIIDDIVDTVYSHEEGFLKSLKSYTIAFLSFCVSIHHHLDNCCAIANGCACGMVDDA
jgi:phosphoribosylpyrophosphate synthetase